MLLRELKEEIDMKDYIHDWLLKRKILLILLRDGIVSHYTYWRDDIKDESLDAYLCCNGDMCGCGGDTIYTAYLETK